MGLGVEDRRREWLETLVRMAETSIEAPRPSTSPSDPSGDPLPPVPEESDTDPSPTITTVVTEEEESPVRPLCCFQPVVIRCLGSDFV